MKNKSIFIVSLIFASSCGKMNSNMTSNLKNGLVAWYPFTGNTYDSSGHGYNGILVGRAVLQNDRFGNKNSAYYFNGEGFVGLSLPSNLHQFSISAWIYPQSLIGVRNGIFSFGSKFLPDSINGSIKYNTSEANIYIDEEGFLQYSLGVIRSTQIDPNIVNNIWHNISFIYSENERIKFYIDGVLCRDDTNKLNVISRLVDHIGSINYLADSSSFIGVIDDVKIWNRVLSQKEITYISTH